MPYDHIGGIYEFIEETGYIIRSKRYKYSDEKLRESFKWTIESSLEQLEKYKLHQVLGLVTLPLHHIVYDYVELIPH